MATSAFPPTRRAVGAVLSAGLAALLFTACSGENTSGGAAADGLAAPERADSEAQTGAGSADASGESAEGGEATEAGAEGTGVGSDVEIADRRLIHTADLAVRVDDVVEAAEQAKDLTVEAGGYVANEHVSTPSSGTPEGSLTLRLPTEGYEDALSDLSELGDRSDLERSVEDVTEEMADVESRIESAETSLETLRGYLEEADDVQDLLRVESEIQTRQSELESFQARMESLSNLTAYSTVNLRLSPPEAYLDEPDEDSVGFLGGLERGWRALVSLGQGLSVVVGWALPFLVVTAVIGAGPWWWYRSRRSARRGTPASAAPVPDTSGPPEEERPANGPT